MKVGEFARPRDLTNRICPWAGNLTKKFALGPGFKFVPGMPGGGGEVTLGADCSGTS